MKYRWCVLEHTGDAQNSPHFDFLFENPECELPDAESPDGEKTSPLLTWSIPVPWPVPRGGMPSWRPLPWAVPYDIGVATRLADHRRIYLAYEGEIGPAPGDPRRRSRGRARRMASGFFETDEIEAIATAPLPLSEMRMPEMPVGVTRGTYRFRMTTESPPFVTWRLTLTRERPRWRYHMERYAMESDGFGGKTATESCRCP